MSMRAFARLMNLPVCRASYAELEHAVRTGAPSVELANPRGFFAYLEAQAKEARVFGEAMAAKAQAEITAVLDAYDFRPFDKIIDVGNGRGHLLRAILEAVPTAYGALFDLPSVISTTEPFSSRFTSVAGDFFVDPLPAANAYVLMEVLASSGGGRPWILLADAQGRNRFVAQLDDDGNASIQFLDADGNVVWSAP